MSQPFYTLQINAIESCFEIKVNDIPLHTDPIGKPTAAELPVNHLLINGENIMYASISPAKHEHKFVDHTKTDFEIYNRDINDLREKRQLIASAKFPDYINDEKLKTSTIHSKTEFKASLPFETPLWSISPVIKLNEQNIREAMDIYREYFNALKNKNIDAIFKLTKIKNKVYSEASYKSLNAYLTNLRESLTIDFADPDNQLIDFDIQDKKPELHAFGKLITIMNDENRSPLQFYNGETGVTKAYPIYLCMKDQKPVIVL